MTPPQIEEIGSPRCCTTSAKWESRKTFLNKAGPLDATEWDTMKTHTELGAKILEPLQPMEQIRLMVRHHHEFYDGTGYPDRLEGEQIPYGARVIAIADAYDTITSERTYKKPRSPGRRIRGTGTMRLQPIRSSNRPRFHRDDAAYSAPSHRNKRCSRCPRRKFRVLNASPALPAVPRLD